MGSWWALLIAIIFIARLRHVLFILAHETAHCRLHANRSVNELIGRFIGVTGGVSMCRYRAIHRRHQNDLYQPQNSDSALHGGYPRSRLAGCQFLGGLPVRRN